MAAALSACGGWRARDGEGHGEEGEIGLNSNDKAGEVRAKEEEDTDERESRTKERGWEKEEEERPATKTVKWLTDGTLRYQPAAAAGGQHKNRLQEEQWVAVKEGGREVGEGERD